MLFALFEIWAVGRLRLTFGGWLLLFPGRDSRLKGACVC